MTVPSAPLSPADVADSGAPAHLGAAEIDACVATLRVLAHDRAALASLPEAVRKELQEVASRVARRLIKGFRSEDRAETRARDATVLEATGIRKLRRATVFPTPALLPASATCEPKATSESRVGKARNCYVCKVEFTALHSFYDAMCRPCGDFNWEKRNQSARLDGRVALVTGARVKIGYQAAIKLLRAGARVIVTTRFPRDAAVRYAREEDYEDFRDRLSVYGLDLRHTPSVERFTHHVAEVEGRLDFIVNNACQTVRRPSSFYAHMISLENAPLDALPAAARPLLAAVNENSAALSSLARKTNASLSDVSLEDQAIFPRGQLDADLQQIDLRDINSWRLPLADVSTHELLEVQLVNAIAPFVLNARLKPLMTKERTFDKHIVNVSAMEGQFYRAFKTDKHPHTNMAKAALNMMTRTSAADYARDGIFMNSVDTGWITDEDPAAIAIRKVEEHGFSPPLDIVDGAARIVAPIFDGYLTGEHVHGLFIKDYRETPW